MKARRGRRRDSAGRSPRLGASDLEHDILTGMLAVVRRVHPVQAGKPYSCPGCNHVIGTGVGHVVVVPVGRPDERRHWHGSCWEHREHRRPGR